MTELKSYMLSKDIFNKEYLTKEEEETLDLKNLPKGVFHDSDPEQKRYYRIVYKGDSNPYEDLNHITQMEVGKTCSLIRGFIIFQIICFIIGFILLLSVGGR